MSDDTRTRALGSLLHDIAATGLRTAEELAPNRHEVRIHGEWFGFGGLDPRGRMILWTEGCKDPHLFGPGLDEPFAWREWAGRPWWMSEPQIEDADERAARGIF